MPRGKFKIKRKSKSRLIMNSLINLFLTDDVYWSKLVNGLHLIDFLNILTNKLKVSEDDIYAQKAPLISMILKELMKRNYIYRENHVYKPTTQFADYRMKVNKNRKK